MTIASSDRPWSRLRSWLAHHPLTVMVAISAAGVATVLICDPEQAQYPLINFALSGLGGLWLFADRRHENKPCVRCLAEAPIDQADPLNGKRSILRVHHWTEDTFTGALTGLIACAAPVVFMFTGPAWLSAFYLLPMCVFAYLSGRHRALRLWCPFCRPWDEDDDAEPEPSPDPDSAPGRIPERRTA